MKYVYMYVCVCICVCVRVYMHLYICVCEGIHVSCILCIYVELYSVKELDDEPNVSDISRTMPTNSSAGNWP